MRRHLVAAACTALFTVAALLPGVPALAAPSLEELYKKLGVDTVSADYIVLIDTSKSMNTGNLYGSVRESLRQFFAALAPEDGVTLITVADHATQVWQGQAGAAPDSVVQRLPATADGAHTDLGEGIAAAIRALQQLQKPIASIVLLTDGQHDPAPGSAYPYAEGYQWQQLIGAAAALKQQISPYTVQLRGTDGGQVLKKVFPAAQVLQPQAIDQLTNRLAEPKAAVRAAKARSILQADLAPVVTVEWPGGLDGIQDGANTVTMRLRSSSTHIPLHVTGLRVDSDTPGVTAEVGGDAADLEPGRATDVPVTVRWDAGPSSLLPWKTVHGTYGLKVTGQVGTPWAEVLSAGLALTVTPSLTGGGSGNGTAQRGSPQLWTGGGVLLLVLVLAGPGSTRCPAGCCPQRRPVSPSRAAPSRCSGAGSRSTPGRSASTASAPSPAAGTAPGRIRWS